MIRAIIVDDEQSGRETLLLLLKEYCPNVEVVAALHSVRSAIDAMYEHSPDLLFLDVEMPLENGFDLLAETDDLTYEVVFTTAYDQYAIPAIKSHALDYLLKPIDADELVRAVASVEQRLLEKSRLGTNLETLLHDIKKASASHHKIALPTSEGFVCVQTDDVIRCEAIDNYTRVHMTTGEILLITRTLKEFEQMLSDLGFARIHKSHLVNLRHIRKYLRGDGGHVVMCDNSTVLVSRRKKDELLQRLVGRF